MMQKTDIYFDSVKKIKFELKERLNALIQYGVDLIGILDEQGIYKYVSPSVKTVLGYEEDFLIEKSAFLFIHPEDVEKVKTLFLSLLKDDNKVQIPDFRFKHADGSWRWINTTASHLIVNNTINGIITNSKDITERKKKDAERELIIIELIRINNDLKQFSFIASHNLRAPLTNIQGLLNIINIECLDTETKEIFGLIKTSTVRLTQTINDIGRVLVFKNNVNISLERINIKKVFNDINNIFFSVENDVNATVITDFEVEEVYYNKVYLESIFTNLISNSIKYRSADHALIISICTLSNKEGHTVLKFSDNGIGIDITRHKNRIFGMYQRFHENSEGTGLGLFMIKSQIEALRGKIDVESEVNKGTAFCITFANSNSAVDKEII